MLRQTMAKVAENLSSTILLNDGVVMPLFGLGTFQCCAGDGGECEKAVLHAVENGYRLLDTAQYYENETDVGRAVRKCGLKREDLFVVSKLMWDSHGAETCTESFKETLRKMDIGYLDLFLIHAPNGGKLVETYNALLSLKSKGLVRSIGVSNFNIHHLEGLKKAGCPTPSVNQFELHPWQRRDELVRYCVDNNIGVMGYSPLVKGQRMQDPDMLKLAEKYGRSVGQVLIRWNVQKGFITIPKSAKPARIKENSEVFDFTISDEDMKHIETFSTKGCTWDPLTVPFDQ